MHANSKCVLNWHACQFKVVAFFRHPLLHGGNDVDADGGDAGVDSGGDGDDGVDDGGDGDDGDGDGVDDDGDGDGDGGDDGVLSCLAWLTAGTLLRRPVAAPCGGALLR